MRIYDSNLAGTSAAESGRAAETVKISGDSNKGTAKSSDRSGDRVELSSTLGHLARAMESFGSARSSRVEALAALYQSGNYRVDSAATSRAMIGEALAAGAK
jgi:anti-sigma28 factor (negative regulator of flagellin synthesis)